MGLRRFRSDHFRSGHVYLSARRADSAAQLMSHATTFANRGCAVKMCGMARTGLWGGRTAEQRRDERRKRMLGSATTIWSEQGSAAVTMRRICADTSVNDRYFYEEFTDKDGLLVAVWDAARDDALRTLTDAYAVWGEHPSWEALTRRVASAFFDWMTANPRYARILLSRDNGGDVLDAHRRNAFHRAIDLVMSVARRRVRAGFDEDGMKMDVVAAAGGFIELVRAWQSGYVHVDQRRIIDHTAETAARFNGRYERADHPQARKGLPAKQTRL
jgi:AcrR family transcriptional regulator